MPDTTPSYPINVAARLSGVSAELIRAWERRYGAIAPQREAGRARRYTPAEVRRLALLRQAVAAGHRIGTLAARSDSELEALAHAAAVPPPAAAASPVATLLEHVERLDDRAAHEELTRLAMLLDTERLVRDVLRPLVVEVGERWHAGTLGVQHEHLVTAQVRGLAETLVRSRAPGPGRPIVLATLPGERHELGLLLYALLALGRGDHVCYLGPDLPVEALLAATRQVGADRVGLGLVYWDDPEQVLEQLAWIHAQLPTGVELWLGGHGLPRLSAQRLPAGARLFSA